MVEDRALGLAWLARAPDDFRARLRQAAAAGEGCGPALRRLAQYRLDALQLGHLAAALRAAGPDARKDLTPLRLALLSDATTGHVAQALIGSGLRHGLALEVTEAPYATAAQALAQDSALSAAELDVVVVALGARALPPWPEDPTDTAQAADWLQRTLAHFRQIVTAQQRAGRQVLVQTVVRPPERLQGSLERRLPGSPLRLTAALNDALETLPGAILFDAAALAETVGLEAWHEPVGWYTAKVPFAPALLPRYADALARTLAGIRGLARKCLVLDLDNTLWGGCVGDDGRDGLVLGQGDPLGEAFLEVQRTALALRRRGVLLAVCSKNDPELAREAFATHPEMLLRPEHISAFVANWDPKPDNLRSIAAELSIGLDSLVLLDDNPAERGLVRSALPDVAVPELGADPAGFPLQLLEAGYFDVPTLSLEDRVRAEQYANEAQRRDRQQELGELDAYLRSLRMVLTVRLFTAVDRGRIAQLINKSNQFNLTTRRRTEAEVQRIETSGELVGLSFRLADDFGDSGLIGVVICRRAGGGLWEIDTWLMSCRVLGRRVEEGMLAELARLALAERAVALAGSYLPTPRNGLVRDHYARLGFSCAGDRTDGATHWRLDLAGWSAPDLPYVIERPA
ncbi:MAG: HAD-superfamily phosphatase subfamily [Phenylobacterium sp.]|nr:HAD-superfamily phosphatase subfamily [Phenylobacterium sp.]